MNNAGEFVVRGASDNSGNIIVESSEKQAHRERRAAREAFFTPACVSVRCGLKFKAWQTWSAPVRVALHHVFVWFNVC